MAIKPPAPIFGSPFTKFIKVSVTNTGDIAALSMVLNPVSKRWDQVKAAAGKLTGGQTSFDLSVTSDEGRGLVDTVAEDWTDVWFGSSQQLIGQHPAGMPFVFGEANFKGGSAEVFSAPGLTHTLVKIGGQKAIKLTAAPAKLQQNGTLAALSERSMTTLITSKTPILGTVLWLEQGQEGKLTFKSMPGAPADQPVEITV